MLSLQSGNKDDPLEDNTGTVHTPPSNSKGRKLPDLKTVEVQDDRSESNVSVKSTTSGKTSRKRRLEVCTFPFLMKQISVIIVST